MSGISIKDNQGTNYDKGFQKAKDALAGAREKAKKIVIFLTDGKPTFHGDSWYSYEKRYYVAKFPCAPRVLHHE